MIDARFRKLRILVRNESKNIIKNILDNHFDPNNQAGLPDVCIFCNSSKSLTKEHVISRWVFNRDTSQYFVTTENKLGQTFNKSTVPTCSTCNNDYLGFIEGYVSNLLETKDPSGFIEEDLIVLIRWLDIIEYKFHVFEFRRKYRASKEYGYLPILADIPNSVMRKNINYSPFKAVAELRQSQKRITIKNRMSKLNSLIPMKTKNKNFHFFHTMSINIFIEIPQFKIALFYFFQAEFNNYLEAQKEAMKIVHETYNT